MMNKNDPDVLRIVTLWNAGKSASQIGKVFGFTRNKAMGKVARIRRHFPELITRQESKVQTDRVLEGYWKATSIPPKQIPKAAPVTILDISNQISLLEIKGNRCRYIVKDEGSVCCGNKGFPWCEFHRAITHTSVPISREDRAKAEEATIAYGLRRTAA